MSGMLSKISALIAQSRDKVQKRHFLDAAMSASALLALADQEISFAELMARDYILDHVTELQVFDPHEAADLFRKWAESIESNPEMGKAKVFDAVVKLAKDPDLAKLLLQVCIAIAKADYSLSKSELELINELAELLGLDASDLDLTIESTE